jgi:ComF family protein
MLEKQAIYGIENYEQDQEKFFDEHLYIFAYAGVIRKAILKYKFNDKSYIYKTFVKILLKNEKFVEKIKTYDIILPIPVSKKRERTRGYNQSELIATEMARLVNIKVANNCLYKEKEIISQSNLNKEERAENIKGAFSVYNSKKLVNKNVLIVDDVYTTGSTVNECSRLIKETGCNKIGILTIAKD